MLRFRSTLTVLVGSALLAACATPGADSSAGTDPWAQSATPPPPSSPPAREADSRTAGAAADPRGGAPAEPVETTRATGKVEWVAVFESPPEARYNDQRVIYVDRNSVEAKPLEKLTYYLARTREVSRSGVKPKIQEIAVLCEGAPSAPATSLRGEGTEETSGTYALKRAASPLTSISQFSTQRVRADANNPATFVVRAVCMLGTGG